MNLDPLIAALRAAPLPARDAPLLDIVPVLGLLARHLDVPLGGAEVPFGRYLLHAEPAFNLQLDVFSRAYRGGIHRHGTWGMFGVLRGALDVEDYTPGGELLRAAYIPRGGAMAFAEASDWHRVSTGEGPQVVSVHLYGPGFDLDVGEAMDERGHRTYRRSPFGESTALQALWRA